MVTIREMTHCILEESVQLFKDTFSKEPWNDNDTYEDIRNLFVNHMNNNYFIGYALYEEDKLVGLSLGFKKPWIKGMEYYIDQFVISYKHQNKGLGSQFINLIEQDLSKKEINAIILNTERGYPSELFYKKNGFEAIEGMIVMAK